MKAGIANSRPDRPQPPWRDISDLIWVQTGFLGDIVLTTAAIELARQAFPTARQQIITTPLGAAILAGCEALAKIHVFDKAVIGNIGLPSALRRLKHAVRGACAESAVVLQAHRSHRSSLMTRALGLPVIGYEESGFAFLAQRQVPRVAVLHEAARIGLLLEPLGVRRLDIVKAMPKLAALPLTMEDAGANADLALWRQQLLSHQGRVVAVAPGSVWGTKRWPPEYFTALVKTLLDVPDLLLLVIGSDAERGIAAQVETGSAGGPRVLNLAGKTSLADLRRLLPRCAMLISNDSSPVHFASALGVPTVAIFGATVSAMGFGPLAPGSVILEKPEIDCRPCGDHGPQQCPRQHFRCMRTLTIAEVAHACHQLLAGVAN